MVDGRAPRCIWSAVRCIQCDRQAFAGAGNRAAGSGAARDCLGCLSGTGSGTTNRTGIVRTPGTLIGCADSSRSQGALVTTVMRPKPTYQNRLADGVFIIANPAAAGISEGLVKQVASEFSVISSHVEVAWTRAPGDAGRYAADAATSAAAGV